MKSSSIGRFSARHARLAVLAMAAVIAFCVIGVWTSATWSDFSDTRRPGESPHDFGRVANRTLGFEKVMAIGLPERSDKRDALDLMAALSGFDIDWVDGVKSSSILDKAVPFGIDVAKVHDNFLGSWRGHMNAIRRIVESGISSALIMEDDMDWDVHLKSQLSDIAHGARHIFGEPSYLPNSPYGDAWDILWLGHCGEPFPETLKENSGLAGHAKTKMSAKYVIKDDDTVPPYSKVSHLVDWSAYAPRTRLVHMTAAPICSFAYAVSQSAARKVLYALSVDGLKMAFDNALAQLCRDAVHDLGRAKDGGYRLKCLSVNPTIMFHHKAKGRLDRDSDIQSHGADGSVRDKGVTEAIKWSVRLNLKNMLTGQPLQPQFGGEDGRGTRL